MFKVKLKLNSRRLDLQESNVSIAVLKMQLGELVTMTEVHNLCME